MLIGCYHTWSEYIRQASSVSHQDTFYDDDRMLLEIQRQGLQIAGNNRWRWPAIDDTWFRRLAVQKIPGTTLKLNAPLVDAAMYYGEYRVTTYATPIDGKPLVEVTRS